MERPDQGKVIKFTGNETFGDYKQKLEEAFQVTAVGVKLGRQHHTELTSFDGKTLQEYGTKHQIFGSKHTAYVIVKKEAPADELDEDADTDPPHLEAEFHAEQPTPPDSATKNDASIDESELKILEELDEGAGGKIYSALWNGALVAVKVCHTGRQDEALTKQLREEATFLKSIRHPNVLQLFGIVVHGQTIKLVMEIMETSLFKRIFQPQDFQEVLTKGEKLRVAIAVTQGVVGLHMRHVVHSDLKLENVLLSANLDSVKICDFGLARIKTTTGVTKLKGEPGGTHMYKAPEMLKNKVRANKATDMWALAGVLAETFTYEVLWSHDTKTAEEIMTTSMRGKKEPTACKSLKANYHSIYDLLRPCFHYDHSKRPTAAALLEALMDVVV